MQHIILCPCPPRNSSCLPSSAGCIDVEVQRGSVLSEALPLLVLPCPAAVDEVRQLERSDAGARLARDCAHQIQDHGLCDSHSQPPLMADFVLVPCSSHDLPTTCLPYCNSHPTTLCTRIPPLVAGIGDVACFLRDIGLVVQFLCRHRLAAQGRPTPRYDAALRRCIAAMAGRCVAAATARGWSALAALLQPATAACEGEEPSGS